MNINNFFYKQLSISTFIKILGTILAFLLQIIIARKLSINNYGIFVFSFSLFFIILIISKLGIDVAATKYISILKNKKELGILKGFILKGLRTTIYSSFIFSILGILILLLFKNSINNTQYHILFILCLIMPISAIQEFFSSYFRAMNKIIYSELPESVIKPTIIIFILTILIIYENDINPIKLLFYFLFASIISLFFSATLFYKSIPKKIFITKSIKFNKLLKKSLPLLFSTGIFTILIQSDIIMLGLIKENEIVALYGPVNKIASFNNFIISILIIVTSPLIAEFYEQKEFSKLNTIIKKTTLTSFIVFIGFFLCILFFGKSILNLYGDIFINSYQSLIILCFGYVFRTLTLSQEFMIMTKYQKEASIIMFLIFIINIFLNYYLINLFSINGAAIATSISFLLLNLAMTVFVYTKTSINVSIFSNFNFK